jgi:hypothetical protein
VVKQPHSYLPKYFDCDPLTLYGFTWTAHFRPLPRSVLMGRADAAGSYATFLMQPVMTLRWRTDVADAGLPLAAGTQRLHNRVQRLQAQPDAPTKAGPCRVDRIASALACTD